MERILFDAVLLSAATSALAAAFLFWNGWKLQRLAEAKGQRDLTHALQRAHRR